LPTAGGRAVAKSSGIPPATRDVSDVVEGGGVAIVSVDGGTVDGVLVSNVVMDGVEAPRRIGQEPAFRVLPIITRTANAMKADVEACRAAGMDDFLSKPIERAALMLSLRRWLPPRRPGASILPPIAVGVSGAEPSQHQLAESRSIEDSATRPPILAEIDIAGTVRRLGIPFERLRPLLIRFADGQRRTVENLREAVDTGDAAAARQHAHALAGAAGNLGADSLREAARALELAASHGNTELSELFREVVERAKIVFQSIDSLRSEPAQTEAPSANSLRPPEPALLRAILQRLLSVLVDGDLSGSSTVVQELAALNVPDSFRAQITRLQEFIQGYEFDEAGEIVDQLLAGSLSGEGS
jgi:CheY-like chemotaxis protein